MHTYNDFRSKFANYEAIERHVEAIRWPATVICPRCNSNQCKFSDVKVYYPWKCNNCRQWFSVTTLTPLHGTKLDLYQWGALLVILYHDRKRSMSALAKELSVTRATAYKMKAIALQALGDPVGQVDNFLLNLQKDLSA